MGGSDCFFQSRFREATLAMVATVVNYASFLGPPFLCAGMILESPTSQNPRAHRSNLMAHKVGVSPTRNACFCKNMSFYLREMHVFENGSLQLAPGWPKKSPKGGSVAPIHSKTCPERLKIMKIVSNTFEIEDLGLKLGVNESPG